jgi:hypothetical protein
MKLITTGPLCVDRDRILGLLWSYHDLAIIRAMGRFEIMARKAQTAPVRRRAERNLATLRGRYPGLAADIERCRNSEPPEVPELLNAARAAEYINISLEKFEQLVNCGCFVPVAGQRNRLFLTNDIENYIEQCMKPQ